MNVEVGGGLIQKENGSVLRQRLRQLNALLLAAGEGGDGTAGEVGQVCIG